MSKKRQDEDDGDVTEITHAEFEKVAGVGSPANRVPFILLKSRVSEPNVAYTPLVSDRPVAAAKAEPKPVSSFGRNAGKKLSPKAREAFEQNAKRVKAGMKPVKGKPKVKIKKLKVKKTRALEAWSALAVTKAVSSEIPATGVPNEAASIMAAVTGESAGLCAGRTQSGTPCRRPAVRGGRCHLHG